MHFPAPLICWPGLSYAPSTHLRLSATYACAFFSLSTYVYAALPGVLRNQHTSSQGSHHEVNTDGHLHEILKALLCTC